MTRIYKKTESVIEYEDGTYHSLRVIAGRALVAFRMCGFIDLNASQCRKLAAWLTRAADRIDGKRGAK